MTIYSTCASCNGELVVERDWHIQHDNCPPARNLSEADMLHQKFVALTAKLLDPAYKATKHDELNHSALQERIDLLDKQPPNLGAAAVYYASHYKWPVFPLKPRTKVPATSHGFQDATRDVDRIRRYWTAVPDANIGLPTGISFDVIDIDLPDGPAEWAQATNTPDIHGQVSTASGGKHLLVLPTGGGNRAKFLPGIDYRGRGGYIVAAPSWLDEGARWNWISKPSPQITGGRDE